MENNIRKLREEKNKTMKQVSDDLGLAYTTYVNYEKGFRKPSPQALKSMSEYFNCSADYILGIKKARINLANFTNALFEGATTISLDDAQEKIQNIINNYTVEDEEKSSSHDKLATDEQAILNIYRMIPTEKRLDLIRQLIALVPDEDQTELAAFVLEAMKTSK